MYGMPEGFADLLRQKYAIMQQQADATTRLSNSSANMNDVRAGLMPAESRANVANVNAQTTNLGLTGQTIIPESRSRIALNAAMGRNYDASAGNTAEDTRTRGLLNRMFTGGLGSKLGDNLLLQRLGM